MTCKTCGAQTSKCKCSTSPYRDPHYHGHGHDHHHHYYYGKEPATVHPDPCETEPAECAPIYEVTGAARPLNYGNFEVRDGCNNVKPFSWVMVTYTGTTNLAPIWSRPSKEDKYLLANPVQTNYQGQAQIYFAGGPVDVTVFCDNGGVPGTEVIFKFTNYGGYVDEDYRTDLTPIVNCPKDFSPLIRVYDKDKCNIPAAFMEPKYLSIMLNIANGQIAGSYEDVKAYYACLGIAMVPGVKVTSTCDACAYYVLKTTCDQECPPDPCDGNYVDNETTCWRRCGVCEDADYLIQSDDWLAQGEIVAPALGEITNSNAEVTVLGTNRSRVIHVRASWANPSLFTGTLGGAVNTILRVGLDITVNGAPEVTTEGLGLETELQPLRIGAGAPQYIQMFRTLPNTDFTIRAAATVLESSGRTDRSINSTIGTLSVKSWEIC